VLMSETDHQFGHDRNPHRHTRQRLVRATEHSVANLAEAFVQLADNDSSNRVVLSSGGKNFILGPRTNPVDPSGRPEIDFVLEPGDELSLASSRSLIGWPTPFEFYIMIHSPWWKRYVYYRLVWKKRSGAKLEMRWRYEQDYYTASGWTDPAMMWNGQTGLLRVNIAPG